MKEGISKEESKQGS